MNLKKLIASTLLLTLSSSLLADIRPGNDPRLPGNGGGSRDPWEDSRPGQDPWERDEREETQKEELQVRQYFIGQSRLDLLQDAYTRARIQGKEIKKIVIEASSEQGNGQARLLVNGQSSAEGAQTLPRPVTKVAYKLDSFANTVGRSLRTLELEMKGRIYVEKVIFHVVEAQRPPGPGPGNPGQPQIEVVRQQLNETIQGEGGLNLGRVFNLTERQGQALARVTILARSARGQAQAQLLVNDQTSAQAQLIGMSSTRITFETNGMRLGQQIQSLRLQVRGNAVIEEVSLEFENRNVPGPGPIQERRIEQVLNQRLYDTNGVAIRELMRLERRHDERQVESVELVLRNADMASTVKLCQTIEGQFQSINCAAPTRLSAGAQVVRLTAQNFVKVKELSLSVRMGMIDIDRIVLNLR
jgi:hypothetical protein